MARSISIDSWLDHLIDLTPPRGVVLVGAGTGTGDWIRYLDERNVANVTLIEGDEEQFQRLRRNMLPRDSWRLLDNVIAQESGPVLYFRASNRAESGLLNPEGLRGIWSNLTTTAEVNKTARPLADIQTETKNPANWVIIDCLPALRILQGSSDPLQFADVVVARVVHDDEALANTALATLKSLTTAMRERGWRLLVSEEGRNPAIGHALFVRDTRALERNLTERLKEAQRDLEATRTQLGREKETRAQAERALKEKEIENEKLLAELTKVGDACTALRQQFQVISHANETLDAALRRAEDTRRVAEVALIERESRIKTLEIELAERQAENDVMGLVMESNTQLQTSLRTAFSVMSERLGEAFDARLICLEKSVFERLSDAGNSLNIGMEACATRLTSIEERAADYQSQFCKLDEHLSEIRAAKPAETDLERQFEAQATFSQEAVKGVETRLCGEINKGLANAVKQVEAFMSIQAYWQTGETFPQFHGWPISPDLGLFLIERLRERQYDLIIEFGSGTSTTLLAKVAGGTQKRTKRGAVSHECRIPKIVTFEHDEHYHRRTYELLSRSRLAQRVQLVHAPLVDWSDERQTYKYYDCEPTLTAIAREFRGRQLRILVLVDGPPAATCVNARYPAVPLVFRIFNEHLIDVVLDDAHRPEEKAVMELWRTIWREGATPMEETSIPSEKGIYLATTQG